MCVKCYMAHLFKINCVADRLTHLKKLANIKQMLHAAFSAETYPSVQRTISLATHRSSLGSKLSKVWNIWDKSNQYKKQQTKRSVSIWKFHQGHAEVCSGTQKTQNAPVKYRLAALPAALRGTVGKWITGSRQERNCTHVYSPNRLLEWPCLETGRSSFEPQA